MSEVTLAKIAELTTATSETQLLSRMQEVGQELGFEKVLYGIELHVPVALPEPVQYILSGYPLDYQELYRQRQFITRDPTVVHCLTSPEPLIWEEGMYSERSIEIFEESRSHGLGHGMSMPVHAGPHAISMLSLARDRPFESAAEQAHVVAAARVYAHITHIVSQKVIVPALIDNIRPHLTPQEQECLRWVAQGKSNWDIGNIMKISEATAAFHVKNLLKKLKVSSRPQAVALGLVLGLIK